MKINFTMNRMQKFEQFMQEILFFLELQSIRIWRSKTGTQLKIIWVGSLTSIMSVSFSRGWIACSYGTTVCLYKADEGLLYRKWNEHIKRYDVYVILNF